MIVSHNAGTPLALSSKIDSNKDHHQSFKSCITFSYFFLHASICALLLQRLNYHVNGKLIPTSSCLSFSSSFCCALKSACIAS